MPNKNDSKPSYFSILTAEVRYDETLSASEKIFYSEISCLCNSKGYCYSSNAYFADLYKVDSRTIRNWLSHLAAKNYIKVDFDQKTNERKIYIIINNSKNDVIQTNQSKQTARKEKNNKMVKNFINSIL